MLSHRGEVGDFLLGGSRIPRKAFMYGSIEQDDYVRLMARPVYNFDH